MAGSKKLLMTVLVIGLFGVLSTMAAGCASNDIVTDIQSTEPVQTQTIESASSADVETEALTNTPVQTEVIASMQHSQNIDEDINSLIYLKDGNTKELVGFAFGDEFNYSLYHGVVPVDKRSANQRRL